MPLSYPYKQNEEDKEIPMLTFLDETMTPFEQLPPEDDGSVKIKEDKDKTIEDERATAK